jgi:hypothetical protein
VFRLGGGFWRNFMSSESAYLLPAAGAGAGAAQLQHHAVAPAGLIDSMDADCGAEPCFATYDAEGASIDRSDAPQGQAAVPRPE